MTEPRIELIYFDGCPHVEGARVALRDVLTSESWTEWNLSLPETPDEYRSYGSPTVLVNGRDVTGEAGGNAAMACRAHGAPSRELIRKALSRRE